MPEEFTPSGGINPAVRAAIIEIVIIAMLAVWLIPLYAMVIDGFKTNSAVSSTPVLSLSSGLSLSAFGAVWGSLAMPIVNSLIVVVPVALISTILGAMGAYFFNLLSSSDRRSFRISSDVVFSIIALATFIPSEAVFVPLLKVTIFLSLYDTYAGIYFAFLIFYLPTGALLMSIFVSAMPSRYFEAARVDGVGDWAIFSRVFLPNILPGFIATVIFIVIEAWNQFFIPLLLTSTPSLNLASLATQAYTGGFGTLYNESFAAAFTASLIPLAIFVVLGRYFIRGLGALGTGAKGV